MSDSLPLLIVASLLLAMALAGTFVAGYIVGRSKAEDIER